MTNYVLVPLHGGSPILLGKAILFLGRGSECDIVLTDSRKVSRKHCCVAQIDSRIMIRDLGSTNGVRINETVAKEESELAVGNVLWVGDLGFRLEVAGASGLKATSLSKRVPLPAKKKEKTSSDYPLPDLPGDRAQATRRRGRSSKNLPTSQKTASDDDLAPLSNSDAIDMEE